MGDERRADNAAQIERFYRDLIEAAPDAVLVIEAGASQYLLANAAAERLLGYARDELLGMSGADLLHPDELPRLAEVRRQFEAAGTWRGEWRLRRKDGVVVPVEATNTRLVAGGRVLYQGLFRDITERKRVEHERERALRAVGERVKELTLLHRAARLLHDTSASTAEVLRRIADILPPAWQYPDVAAARVSFDGLAATTAGFVTTPWTQAVTFTTADGWSGSVQVAYLAERPEADEGPFLRQERDLLESLAEMLRGHFERQAAEAALVRRELQIRALVEHATDSILHFDRDLRLIYVNPAGERLRGCPADELLGKTSAEAGLLAAEAPAWELALKHVFRTGAEVTLEVLGHGPTGDRRPYQARLSPVLGPDGSVESVMAIARDVSDQKRAEEERERLYRELMDREDRLREMIEEILFAQGARRSRDEGTATLLRLTPRERDILRLLAAGRTNQQIGRELGLSAGTVRNHISHLLPKLGASDRTQAAVRALELGILD